jgi:hypothetical protein
LSVVLIISFDLLDIDELNIITETMLLSSSVWITSHSSVGALMVAIVVMFFVSVVLAHHLFKVGDFAIESSDSIEDNTIASLALETFFSTDVRLFSWDLFTETLLSVVWCNISTKGSTMTFDPSLCSSQSLYSEVNNIKELVSLWSLLRVDRVWFGA